MTNECICKLLAFYSLINLIMIVPSFFHKLLMHGYHESVCLTDIRHSYLYQPHGRWIFYFQLSKLVELGDTLFLMLRGKDIAFLHWYHHIITLGFGYVQCLRLDTTFEWIAVMNLFIHTWMYSYYALTAFHPNKSRGNKWLTRLQILQMFHGLFLSVYHDVYCGQHLSVYVPRIALSVLYAIMFLQMYVVKYSKSKSAKD